MSYRISWDWVTNLNDDIMHLTFHIIRQPHIVHFVDFLTGVHFTITHDGFEAVIKIIKAQYIVAYAFMITELECRFLDHELMDPFQKIYP
jgi:hypothetical protein